MDLHLKDHVALVAGGTGGIGSATVRAFLAEGAKVAFSSISQAEVDALLAQEGVDPDRARGFVVDLTDEGAVAGFVRDATRAFGTIDHVVAAAGIEGTHARICDMDVAAFERVYAINVFSVLMLAKHAGPVMAEKGGGSMVVLASSSAYEPIEGNSDYSSSKYAVAGLTKCIANELGPSGVHVNYVCPGCVDTAMMRRIEVSIFGEEMPHQKAMSLVAEGTLDKRYARPEEIANAILFLSSDVTSHVAGLGLRVDSNVPGVI
jgi:NAD(P)-dependent dehydrogenase (short-subunit alcohol dehydrogenase family)